VTLTTVRLCDSFVFPLYVMCRLTKFVVETFKPAINILLNCMIERRYSVIKAQAENFARVAQQEGFYKLCCFFTIVRDVVDLLLFVYAPDSGGAYESSEAGSRVYSNNGSHIDLFAPKRSLSGQWASPGKSSGPKSPVQGTAPFYPGYVPRTGSSDDGTKLKSPSHHHSVLPIQLLSPPGTVANGSSERDPLGGLVGLNDDAQPLDDVQAFTAPQDGVQDVTKVRENRVQAFAAPNDDVQDVAKGHENQVQAFSAPQDDVLVFTAPPDEQKQPTVSVTEELAMAAKPVVHMLAPHPNKILRPSQMAAVSNSILNPTRLSEKAADIISNMIDALEIAIWDAAVEEVV
jgi:hypothetical protein